MASKPKVLVLGGCGFIGRNLVTYLIQNDLASKVLVADKVLPDLAGLSAEQLQIYKGDRVIFKQSNLARAAMVEKLYAEDGGGWEFVFNLAGETKYSQTDEVYKENVIDISAQNAAAAKKAGVKKFVEVSTAQVYEEGKKPSAEDGKIKPWTSLAKARLAAEEEVKKSGVPFNIVRPAVVYGPGDINGVMPRVICGAVYKQLGETMEFLWDKDLKINTVHVEDVAAALWLVATKAASGEVYNLADEGDTDQGEINKVLEEIFGIKTSFMGFMKSKAATAVAMKTVAETANEKHLKPWSDMCKAKGVGNTPLTPYLDEELLYNNALSINGAKIKALGFAYKHPKINAADIRAQIKYTEDRNFFPKGFC